MNDQPHAGPSPRLPRPTLSKALTDAALSGHVASIVAPAGSGKSTVLDSLAAQLREQGYSCYWISLDASNNDPHNFLRRIWLSLRDVDPEQADTQMALLKANKESELSARFQALLDMLAVRGRKLALCLDDFHHISNTVIVSFMNELLRHISTNVSLTIASRTSLPLDMGRRRVAGSLMEITPAELSLSADEVREYLKVVHGLEIGTQDVEVLHRVTEGWAAGVQLAALAIRNAPAQASHIIGSYSSADQNLKEYLFQTVLRGLPEDLREFLLLTAPLKRLSAALCDAVTQRRDGQLMLEQVESMKLFLIRLDQNNVWFRYHHLFSEFLLHELRRRSPSTVQDVYLRAAQWNQAEGYLTDAIQNLLDAGQVGKAAELINDSVTHVALDFGDHSKILDWMRRLPTELHDNNPTLLLNHAWSRAFSRDSATARELCERATELIDNLGDQLPEEELDGLRWFSRVISVLAVAAGEKTQSAIPGCEELIAKLPRSEPVLIASISNTLAYCHLVHHNLREAISAAAEAYQFGMRGGSTYSTLWGIFIGGLASLQQADLQAAEEHAAKARAVFAESVTSGPYLRALTALLGVEIAVQSGQFRQAQRLLTEHRVMSSIYGPSELLILLYRNEAIQTAWNGSPGLARKLLQQGQDIGLSTDQHGVYLHLVAEEIALQLQFENLAAAESTAKRTNFLNRRAEDIDPDIQGLIVELQNLTRARLMLARGENQDVMRLLHRLMRTADMQGRKARSAHLRAMRAVAMWKLSKTQDALRELDRAISVCYRQNLVYPIASVGHALIDVLEEIIERRESVVQMDDSQAQKREFAEQVRSLILGEARSSALPAPTTPPEPDSARDALQELTKREIEILRLIASGLNNQELANELLITLSTAKWHLHNVFRKMGVKNRVAAISLARRAQLI